MIYSQAWVREAAAQIVATSPHSMEETVERGILKALADSGAVLTEAWE